MKRFFNNLLARIQLESWTKKDKILAAVLLSIIIVSCVGIGLQMGNSLPKALTFDRTGKVATPTPTVFPTNTPTPTLSPESSLSSGTIAYIKDGDVYLMDKNGKKQITKGQNVANLVWSKDGKYLGWINRKVVSKHLNNTDIKYFFGFSISVLNFATQEIKEVLTKEVNLNEPYGDKKITGFDFSPDAQSIAYAYDGIWIKALQGPKDEKILENKFVGVENQANEQYHGVDWNPQFESLLLRVGLYEGHHHNVYDLPTKTLIRLSQFSNYVSWSQNGEYFIIYNNGYAGEGLWFTKTLTGETIHILGSSRDSDQAKKVIPSLSVASAIIQSDNTIYAVIGIGDKTREYKIYKVALDGTLEMIVGLDKPYSSLQVSPDGKYFTYWLFREPKDGDLNGILFIVNVDGSDKKVLLNNISSYSWRPL